MLGNCNNLLYTFAISNISILSKFSKRTLNENGENNEFFKVLYNAYFI